MPMNKIPNSMTTDQILGYLRQYPELGHEIALTLPERERSVLILLHGIGCEMHSLSHVAELMSLSITRVRQIDLHAIRKLRHHSRKHLIDEHMSANSEKNFAQNHFHTQAQKREQM